MTKPNAQTDPRIDQAMNMVLEKEHHARSEIELCEREAATLLDNAQRSARAITERTDKRITALRQRCEKATGHLVDKFLAEHDEHGKSALRPEQESARIDAAVYRLTEKLTGAAIVLKPPHHE